MTQDELKITVLEDGRIKIETDTISPANHTNADGLLKLIAQLMGGETITQPKAQAHTQTHRGQQAGH